MVATSPSSCRKPLTIAIAGGGIGGLAFAIGLLRQNVPFHLYEAAHEFAEVGAGVSFGPNSLRAMTLIDPAITKGYNKRATHNAWDSKRTTWFDFRLGQDIKGVGKAGDAVAEVKAKDVGQSSIHRAAFLDELVALVPDDMVSFGKRVLGVEELGEGNGVKLLFSDGGQAEASAVVGCDGVKSNLRRILLGEDNKAAHASFTGMYAYRGLIPMTKAVDLMGDELARNSQMYIGYHGHVLTFPIEKGEIMNVVAFRTKQDGKWDNEKWVLPMQKSDMEGDFVEWGESVKEILSLMEKPDLWALFDHPPADTYYKNNLAMLGDSAHASTPHQGAGAGMALEDAYVLSNLLGSVQKASEIENAFKAYDAVRRHRTQKLVTTSREAGEIYEFEGKGIGDDLDAMRQNLGTRYDWIWEKKLEDDLSEAMNIMGVRP